MQTRFALLFLCFTVILTLALPVRGLAQATSANETRPDLGDRVALEAFVDGLMAAQLAQFHVPGATVAIVHDGELALAKGYGYADLATLTPVDADVTLFRIGSITKLFTWTAVMQLVEAGELDLTADINDYLAGTDVRVPTTYLQPITMLELMAHTPGFEDRSLGLFARDESALAPLETLLLDLPQRVRPPGQVSSYSNHGSALAALVVAQISGMTWEEYVETHILTPLVMTRTTVRQPVPPSLIDDLAQSYTYVGGRQREEFFEFVPLAPAGVVSATATDMARFMLAHLQLGRLDNAQILQSETAQQMQTQHFTHDPLLPGMAHGFMEYSIQGDRWFGHGGDTLWFHSGLYLSPDHSVGIFVGYNGAEGGAARESFFTALREHYFDDANGILPTPPTATVQQLRPFAGVYGATRSAVTTPDKIANLFLVMNIGVDPAGYLVMSGLGRPPTRWTELGPGRFRMVEDTGALGHEELLFHFDAGPNAASGPLPMMAYYSPVPIMAFVPLAWYETPLFHAVLFVAALLLFLAAVIAWPIQSWQDRRRPRRRPRGARIARWLGWAAALTFLVYWIGFLIAFSDPMSAVFGMPPIFNWIGWLPAASIILVIAMWALAALAWQHSYWRRGGRIFYTLVALAATATLWQLWYWNFLQAPLIL